MDKFDYTYKAVSDSERKEIEYIKRQYQPDPQMDGLAKLRRLNNKVNGNAMMAGLVSGVVGLLIFGGGMAMILEFAMIALGIVLCVVGVPPMAIAYPLYKKVLARGKAKYGDEIISLTEQLLGDKNENH